jgi:rhamnosyltransferase
MTNSRTSIDFGGAYAPQHEPDHSAYADCAAIVVTYRPEAQVFERQMSALCAQIGLVVVVDNNSGPGFKAILTAAEKAFVSVKPVFLDRNYGIAYAQNRGLDIVIRSGKKYVLFLDHDSVPAAGMVANLYSAAESLLNRGVRLAAVGARLIDPRSGKENGFYSMRRWRWRRLRCGDGCTSTIVCDHLNSSGSLHPVDAIARVGRFDESLFIDHVDSDWFMRARALGYEVYGVCPAILSHPMGNYVVKYWLFGWRHMPHRSPGRHYYIVRNALWLYRRPYSPFFWKINNAIKLLLTLFYFGLFDTQRKQQANMILKGFWDGLLRRPSATENL